MINCWWIRITAAVEVEYSPSVLLPVQIRSASCQTQMDCHSSEHRSWAARWKQPADWKQDRISLRRCDHGPELTDCFWYTGSSSPENRRGEWWGHTHTQSLGGSSHHVSVLPHCSTRGQQRCRKIHEPLSLQVLQKCWLVSSHPGGSKRYSTLMLFLMVLKHAEVTCLSWWSWLMDYYCTDQIVHPFKSPVTNICPKI